MNTIEVITHIANTSIVIDSICVCQIDYSKDDKAEDKGIESVLFHRKNLNYTFVPVDEHLEQTLRSMELVGYVLNSQVKLRDGSFAHLPLMDFLCEVNDRNTEEAEVALNALKIGKGYLMNSGSSYHFIGSNPIIEQDYFALMHRALLLSPLTDGRWIAHQLINGTSNLRMGEKEGVIPQLIKKIDD